MIEGYRAPEPIRKRSKQTRADLALEFSDLQVMLFKLAYQCGIDMEEAMLAGQRKADQLDS